MCTYVVPPGTGVGNTAQNQRSSILLLQTHYPAKFISTPACKFSSDLENSD